MVREARRQDPLIADPSVGEDQHRAGVAQGEVDEAVSERRQAAAGVDQNWDACAFCQREDPCHLLAFEAEVLCSRM